MYAAHRTLVLVCHRWPVWFKGAIRVYHDDDATDPHVLKADLFVEDDAVWIDS